MKRRLLITTDRVRVEADLDATPTADAIWDALPVTAQAHTWGDEIYFPTPLTLSLEPAASALVAAGDLGYWPAGPALCIFFGPTPVSQSGEIRAASEVNLFGRVAGDATVLRAVRAGDTITIERLP